MAARKLSESDSDIDDEASYIRCPVSLQVIDQDMIVPNKMLKRAIEVFIEQNPWAFRFDPREKY